MAPQVKVNNLIFVSVFFIAFKQSWGLMNNSTDCPLDCECIPDNDVPDGTEVRCIGIGAVPDSWPEGTTSVRLELQGFPGIPSGAFLDMNNLCTVDISGEVGVISAGAFENVVGDGCDHYDRPLSQNRLIFLAADITTIEEGAFNNVRGFQYFQFMQSNRKGDIDRITNRAFTNIEQIQVFSFEYIQVRFLEDDSFVAFRDVDLILFEAATILGIELGEAGPFSDLSNVKTIKFEQMKSTNNEWEHGITTNFFTGVGSGVTEIVFLNFNISVIMNEAFENVKGLKRIVFDDVNVETVLTDGFKGLEDVEEIIFKGYSRDTMATVLFRERAFRGMKNIKRVYFEYMIIDFAEYNFEGAEIGALHFYQSRIDEGDRLSFLGLTADSVLFECIQLPNETQTFWNFGLASRIGHLSFQYNAGCPIRGEAWLDFATVSRSTAIEKITFSNTTIKNIDRLAFYDLENVEELSFTDCTIERTEPNAFFDFKNFGKIVFRRVKWGLFLPQTFTDFSNIDQIELDDVDLGANGIFPSEAFIDIDAVDTMRFHKLNAQTMSTRSFGWDSSSSNISLFEISDSSIFTLQSFAFPGLTNVGTFRIANNNIRCMETGAFMNMKGIQNKEFVDTGLACDPIFDVPWHMDWEDRVHCVTDTDKKCLKVVDPTTPSTGTPSGPPTDPTDPPTASPSPTIPDNGAEGLAIKVSGVLLCLAVCLGPLL